MRVGELSLRHRPTGFVGHLTLERCPRGVGSAEFGRSGSVLDCTDALWHNRRFRWRLFRSSEQQDGGTARAANSHQQRGDDPESCSRCQSTGGEVCDARRNVSFGRRRCDSLEELLRQRNGCGNCGGLTERGGCVAATVSRTRGSPTGSRNLVESLLQPLQANGRGQEIPEYPTGFACVFCR